MYSLPLTAIAKGSPRAEPGHGKHAVATDDAVRPQREVVAPEVQKDATHLPVLYSPPGSSIYNGSK